MQALIIDDNTSLRNTLKRLLELYTPQVQIIGEADGVQSGIAMIRELQPELVFLDVEMQDGTGFDLLSMYGPADFKVIFVTGHDKFALKAFKFSALDYVLKPVDPDDLVRAVEKSLTLIASDNRLRINSFLQNQHATQKKIVLNDAQNTYLVGTEEIIRCEADVNYTRFYLSENRVIMVSKTLKSFDELLGDYGFFRSHQSHLVNLTYFDRYDKTEGGVLFLKNGESVPVSTRKKDDLMAILSQM